MNVTGEDTPQRRRYRTASEIGTYLYCRRAWWFERQGAPSSRAPERARGTAHHQQHGVRVDAARRSSGLAQLCLLFAVVLLLLALWTSWR
jgi:CRISPR/Cas system-associated exonuclease Cas4 (RecB family)